MRRLLAVLVVLAGLSLPAVSGWSVSAASPGELSVVPVRGKAVGQGLKLSVFVFYARGGTPGPPPGHGGGGGAPSCTDTNTQGGYATPFASASPLTFHLDQATVPSGLSAADALGIAVGVWKRAGARLALKTDGSQTVPARDGTSAIGWARIVPKNVLAATWTWTDDSNHVVEADVFFNTTQPWATLYPSCPTTATGRFDVADIGTHELGHTVGLDHYSDSAAQATMYPTAPPDEIRKVTLTAGDEAALHVALGG